MQGMNGIIHPVLINDTGYPYLGCADDMYVDAPFAERFEHSGGITGCILHADANYTDLAQLEIACAISGAD